MCKQYHPRLVYSAALIGYGSDVMGVDTAVSMDHNWGPRLQLFLSESDHKQHEKALSEYFSMNLPFSYKGFPVNFSDPRYDNTQTMTPVTTYPVNHLIEIHALSRYLDMQIGVNSTANLSSQDWLRFLDQNLIELTTGRVFHDGLGSLQAMRETLAFYPRDIRLLRLAALWQCVWNEEPFIGRCRDIKDILGIKTISARLVDLLVKIVFYIEAQYIPYSKWRGLFFRSLKSHHVLNPIFGKVLNESDPKLIENSLVDACAKVVALHNAQADLPALGNTPRNFFGRPYKVIFAESIVKVLVDAIRDDTFKKLPLAGVGLDIKVDGSDFRSTGVIRKLIFNSEE
ncbi:MAG: DUF4037 domain-containing protein [Spirochaetales bacterium]|nr:DUF4037 domain-containing protein [Spirochaetales bacterium]